MMNSFLLLPDGWVYACHGYLNSSVVRAKDGSEVRMQSGNTFAFAPMVRTSSGGPTAKSTRSARPLIHGGNLYTADCHSKPITQLIHGAYYDSFGNRTMVWYAPHVARHDHGSTALCGLVWYNSNQFPAKYKGMFLGNVVTNRINSDKIVWARRLRKNNPISSPAPTRGSARPI